jgi:ADP-ribosylglycohydrolase
MMAANKHSENNYTACLLGGAIGDALGWPVEFSRLSEIKRKYGEKGISDLIKTNGKVEITDDTQMTIFTADGLLKSASKAFDEESMPDMNTVYNSYQDWLATQKNGYTKQQNGWISQIKDLYVSRAPGNTCLGALIEGKAGSIEKPPNRSEGCGGVMRVAPAGLMYYKNPETAFEAGARCAALTHGHPNAYLAAGVHAAIIANMVKGKNAEQSVDDAVEILSKYAGSEKLLSLIENAKIFAKSDISPESAIKTLGEGWHGDEAIAISIYCVLKENQNFEKALIMAVNHDGDSDSTGSIVGNILGAYLGLEKIPQKWREEVELSKELTQIAKDLYNPPSEIENAKERYPI